MTLFSTLDFGAEDAAGAVPGLSEEPHPATNDNREQQAKTLPNLTDDSSP